MLVSKKRYKNALSKIDQLESLVEFQTSRLDKCEDREIKLSKDLRISRSSNSNLNKVVQSSYKKVSELTEENYLLKEKAAINKGTVLGQVREKLLEEIKKDKEGFAWEKFALIADTKMGITENMAIEKGFYIMQFSFIEKILVSLEKSTMEKIKEVDAEW